MVHLGPYQMGLYKTTSPMLRFCGRQFSSDIFSPFQSSQDHLLQLKLTFTAKASESESNGLTESFQFIFIFIFVRVRPILHLPLMDSLVTSCSSPITSSSSSSSFLPIFFPRRFLPSRPLLFSLASKSTCFNFFLFFFSHNFLFNLSFCSFSLDFACCYNVEIESFEI